MKTSLTTKAVSATIAPGMTGLVLGMAGGKYTRMFLDQDSAIVIAKCADAAQSPQVRATCHSPRVA